MVSETTPLNHRSSSENGGPVIELPRPNLLLLLVLTAGATSITLGYDVGIMAVCIVPLQKDMNLTSFQKEVILGSLNFLAAAGALGAGKFADLKGRKTAVQVCAWLFVVGTLLMALANDFNLLLLGRVVTGLGVGVSFLVAPVYITEVAPSDRRGELNTVFDLAINGGILLGYVVGFVVHLVWPGNWRLMLAIGLLPPIAILVTLAGLPESPRWLMMRNRGEEAIEALQSLGNSADEARQLATNMQDELDHSHQTDNVWWGPNHRLAIGLGFFQQIAGSEAFLYYSSEFLAQAGMASPTLRLLGNCSIGLCKLAPEVWAMQYVDRLGRRTLMLTSAVLRFAFVGALAIAFSWDFPAVVMLGCLCAIMASFSAGLGPFTYLCASENLGVRERATGMTYCSVANRLTSGTVALTVESLRQWMGNGKLFAMYTLFAALSLPFYWQLPETSGKTLEEIQKSKSGGKKAKALTATNV